MAETFLIFLVVVLGAAVAIVPLTSRLGMGSVIGYLGAGILIGPDGLGLIKQPDEILHLAEFGVVMLLFLIGLGLNPRRLWSMKKAIFGLGLSQVLATTGLIFAGLLAYGWSWEQALVVAMGFSMSSTAIAMQMIDEQGLKTHPAGQNGFSILLLQDLAVIPMLIFVALLGQAPLAANDKSSGQQIILSIIAIAAIIVIGRYLARPVFRWIASTRLRELSVGFSLFIIFSISLLMHYVGLSMALGAFLAGVILAESEYRHELEANIEPFKGLLLGLFFLAIGMTVKLDLLVARPLELFTLLVTLLSAKLLVLAVIASFFKMDKRNIIVLAILLSQGGEFAFVLFGEAVRVSALTADQGALLNAVVTLSMLTTPLLMFLFHKFVAFRLQLSEPPHDEIHSEGHPVIIAGFGRMGQIIARLLGTHKILCTVIDHNPSQIDFVRRFGLKVFYGDASQIGILEAAGVKDAKLLVITIDHQETVNRLVTEVQRLYPHLPIVVRARDRTHTYQLLDLGLKNIERETFGAALSMGQMALKVMGVSTFEAHRIALRFKAYDLNMIKRLYPIHRDEQQIISQAREARESLERLLTQDMEKNRQPGATGWD